MSRPLVAIYGATGHTGRLVAAELIARGREVLLSGRDGPALLRVAEELGLPAERVHPAGVDEPEALRAMAARSRLLIQCAGPFAETGVPLAAAAVAAGCHYLDHAVENHHVQRVFERFESPAQAAGIVMLPAFSLYGGLGDLLAGAVAEGLGEVESISVGYAVSGWMMTPGAQRTYELLINEPQRLVFTNGVLFDLPEDPRIERFAFPPPLGEQEVLAPFPVCEPVTVPRHVPVRRVEAGITVSTIGEPQVFANPQADDETRSRNSFTVAVRAETRSGVRQAHLRGEHLWRAAVLASVEAAEDVLDAKVPLKPGVHAPAEFYPPAEFLRRLERIGAFSLTLQERPGE